MRRRRWRRGSTPRLAERLAHRGVSELGGLLQRQLLHVVRGRGRAAHLVTAHAGSTRLHVSARSGGGAPRPRPSELPHEGEQHRVLHRRRAAALPPASTAALCAARRSRSSSRARSRGVRRPAWTEHLGHLGCEAGLLIGACGGGRTTGLETPPPGRAQRVGRVVIRVSSLLSRC